MVEGSYNIGTEEPHAKFLKAAKKSGVKEVAEAARTTTLVTPWICSRDELGRESVKLVGRPFQHSCESADSILAS